MHGFCDLFGLNKQGEVSTVVLIQRFFLSDWAPVPCSIRTPLCLLLHYTALQHQVKGDRTSLKKKKKKKMMTKTAKLQQPDARNELM